MTNDMKISIFLVLLMSGILMPLAGARENLPLYNLSVSFDIPKSLIKGVSTITLPEDREMNISTGDLNITSVRLNGILLNPEIKNSTFKINGRGVLEISFNGKFEENESLIKVSNDIISKDEISLIGLWYPYIKDRAYYHLKAILPEGFEAVSEANDITIVDTHQGKEDSFNFSYPVNGIELVAGKYNVMKDTSRNIDIYVYFFPKDISRDIIGYLEDVSRARTYIEYAKRYLKEYDELIGPYPYKRFSIVESIPSAGYSMPTFIALGSDVMRLPFIVDTSLGHEILHQWFGNYVYNDFQKGNWIEGLTSYQSDQLYKEQKGEGWQYRKKILVDYESYVKSDKEIQLADFFEKIDPASGIIGYGKGSMLFSMLNDEIGDDAFYRGLKRLTKEKAFQEATWDDLRMSFENTSGRNLKTFFDEWLYRKGEISLEIKDPRMTVLNGIPTVSFKTVQKEPYEFNLSLKINTDKDNFTKILTIKNKTQTFEIPSNGTPKELIFDDDYNLMRRLSEKEYPSVISRLLGDEKKIIVIPEKDKEKYNDLINIYREDGFVPKEENEIKDKDITTSSLLVLGNDSSILKRLFGEWKNPESGFSLTVVKNPLNTSNVIAVAYGSSKEDVDLASKKISHYGQYSYIRFEKGKNVDNITEKTDKGIIVDIYEPMLVIQPQRIVKLDDIINDISNKTIIYVGETHDRYEDHNVQLAIIGNLYEKGYKFAIGMEMFQKPFQKVIDDYMSGNITEKEFLKQTRYFKKWGYDYNLYREIINLAKAKNIRIVALNIRSEIIENVSKRGLDSLNDSDKKEIPVDMDMSDEDYKDTIKQVLDEQHGNQEFGNFNYFYQSQILWDETMAHSIDEFLKQNPDYHMVILAGMGHVMYDSGIPKRVYRLNHKDYITLIQGSEYIDKDIGSYIVLSRSISQISTPQFGIILNETNNSVRIMNVENESIADKAGLRKDDIFVSIDDWNISSIEDLRIAMFDKKESDTIKVKILRKTMLGDKEIGLNITL